MYSGITVSQKPLFFYFYFLFLILTGIAAHFLHLPALAFGDADGGSMEMRPVASTGLRTALLSETRRRLGNFQVCAPCTCCGGPRRLCLPSPCCYAINCNIPNRPFGFCSFTPKACNCLGCSI